jgi:transcriptional regulator with XRE-family HTH domain
MVVGILKLDVHFDRNSYDRRNLLMKMPVSSAAELGLLIRSVRRASGVRIDDLAATAGMSKQFVQDVEYGKPSVQLGLVLKLLAELGMPLTIDIPEAAAQELPEVRKRAAAKLKARTAK